MLHVIFPMMDPRAVLDLGAFSGNQKVPPVPTMCDSLLPLAGIDTRKKIPMAFRVSV